MSLCEKDCDYIKYDNNTKKVLCECFTKSSLPILSDIKINKDKLINNFIDIKTTTNLELMKCYKRVFNLEDLKYNIGNYILISIIFLEIILAIIFKIKGYNKIKNLINKIIQNKNKNETTNINIENKNKKKTKNNRVKKVKNNPPKIKKIMKKLKKKDDITNNNNNMTSSKIEFKNTSKNISRNLNIINNKIKNNKIKFIKYNDYELNNLLYREALKTDKRTYFQYYFSLLKMKQLLIFTFYTNNDYNSRIIKIYLFIFSFALYLTINALFFNDSTIHQIYKDKGTFNFIHQIQKILYSSVTSSLINSIINYLSLSEKNIIKIKNEKNKIEKKKILKCLKIKFILFYIISFLFLLLFWYYLSSFCAIFKNTQIHLIKDTLISYGLSLLYPFILNLFPGIFRIPSLKSNKKECLYKLSKYLQLI